MDLALKKMNKTEVKGVVGDIVELKEWVNNLPVLEKNVDVHVKAILDEVKINKLTNIVV